MGPPLVRHLVGVQDPVRVGARLAVDVHSEDPLVLAEAQQHQIEGTAQCLGQALIAVGGLVVVADAVIVVVLRNDVIQLQHQSVEGCDGAVVLGAQLVAPVIREFRSQRLVLLRRAQQPQQTGILGVAHDRDPHRLARVEEGAGRHLIAGREDLIFFLKHAMRSFVFSAALPPASAATPRTASGSLPPWIPPTDSAGREAGLSVLPSVAQSLSDMMTMLGSSGERC